jgi:predicted CXXCH cytochrome family protein
MMRGPSAIRWRRSARGRWPGLAAYRDSPHGPEFRNRRRPGCVTCHAPHDTAPAETVMLTGPNNVCARCHKPGSAGIRDGVEIARLLGALERSALSAEAQERLGAAVHTFDPAAVRRAVEAIRSGPAAGGE